jgi:hypothetical protein
VESYDLLHWPKEPGSSVSVVSGYRQDDRTIAVRSAAEGKGSSSILCVQTSSEATQPPVQWVLGVISPTVKRGRSVMLTTHPYGAEAKNE